MTTFRFILLIFALIGVFISGGLFFRKSNLKHRTIAVFIGLLSIEYIDFLYNTSSVAHLYPTFIGMTFFPIGFLYGPLLFIHTKSVLGKEVTRKDWLQFVPFILIIISLYDVYSIQDGMARRLYLTDNFFYRFLYYNYLRSAYILIYGIIIFIYFLKKSQGASLANKSYSIGVMSIYFVSAMTVTLLTEFASGYRDFVFYYLISSFISLFIGYLLYTQSPFLMNLGKYLSSSLSEAEMESITSKVKHALEADQSYLNRELSLADITKLTGESSHRISQTLSAHVGKNFNDYINTYRIDHAKKLLIDSAFDHYKIEAIAIDSGFNNKVTFYKAFAKVTGTTPSSYRKFKKSGIE
ncbi:helix-turn-helix domain-containing protein [Ekhidna sp. To15]|uniref:helix-turn-helix domain-containing protein n=1 Tax=Ekhidna sp. To15 TaxID=3395267 RepID=UPI003F51EFEA